MVDHSRLLSWMAQTWNVFGWPEICLALFFLYWINFYQKQRHLPAFDWPIVRMLPALLLNLSSLFDWVAVKLDEAGGTYLFKGPSLTNMEFLATCDPRNIEYILKTGFANFPKGNAFFEIFYDLFGNGIGTADGEAWMVLRRHAHKLVHSKDFREFVARTTHGLVRSRLLPLLEEAARRGSVVDLQDLMLRFTFDSTCITVFGSNPGCLAPALPTVPLAKAMDDFMESILYRHVVPVGWWKLLRRLNLGKEKQLAEAKASMEAYITEQVGRLKASKHRGSDVLSHYLSISTDETYLRDTAVNFLTAGRDTSGTALSWFFWLVSKHPKVGANLLKELNGIISKRSTTSINDDSFERFSEEELQSMVYLHACLCETLRLYPPAPIESKTALRDVILPDGTVVKAGTPVLYIIYAVGRMSWVWGKDCMQFKPERWFDEHGLVRHESNGFRFLAFNGGPRACVGKDMAFVQMKYAAAHILLNFEIEVVKDHPVSPKVSVIMTMKDGLLVRVKKRDGRRSECGNSVFTINGVHTRLESPAC